MRRFTKTVLLAVLIFAAGILLQASITQPPIGGWLSAGSMNGARSGAASALLQDGRILIVGGDNGSGPVASAEFSDTTGAFVAAPPMSTPRSAHSATLLADGRILVAGGSIGAAATNAAEIFDPALNSWTAVAGGMVQARSNHTASLLADGRVLFAGGDNAGTPTASLEIFDPVAGAFSSVGVMSSPRTSFASAVLSDGRVTLIGGSNGNDPLASTEIFDPLTNSISAGPALSAPRMNHSATALLDGRVLVAGGRNVITNADGSTTPTDLASAEIYDPATASFSVSASSLTAPRRGHEAFLLPNNNSVLIVGGTSSGNEVGTAEMFVPATGTFAPTGSPAAARQQATGTALKQDGILFLAGGSNSTGTLSSAELYGFATVKTDQVDYSPGSIVTITGSGWRPGETITLTLVESPLVDTHPVMTAVADSTGKFVNTDFSPDVHDINVRFYLTAVGSISGIQAQNTFTDGNVTSLSGTVRSNAAGNPPISGATITCTAGCNNSPAASTTSGATGAYVFDSSTTKLNFATNGPVTITLTASAPGFNSAALALSNVNNGNTFTGKDFTLTPSVSGTTTTTVASSPNPSTYGGSVTFTATVARSSGTNTPTGTVSIKEDATAICTTGILTGGSGTATASCAVSTLAVSSSPHSITAVYGGDANFTGSTSAAISQTVNAAPVTVTFTASDKPYDGTTTATVSNCVIATGKVGTDDVTCTVANGNFASANASASAQTVSATATLGGTEASNYAVTNPVTTTATINKADQTITWVDPAGITYGTALSATQLNATVAGVSGGSAPGALTYTPAAGALLDAGAAQALRVDAASTVNYNPATKTVHIDVAKADQTITWVDPAGITYGTALSATQLNATVAGVSGGSAPGALTYTPAAGALLDAGAAQALRVDAASTVNYNPATKTVHIDVAKADQTITWADPAGITYGTALSATQLNATVAGVSGGSAPGALTYTPAAGALLDAGAAQALRVDAASTVNYNPATKTVHIDVAKADQTITWADPAGITYGTALSATQLNATVAGVSGGSAPGALTYTPGAGTLLNAGAAQALRVDAASTVNYNPATKTVHINVSKATPTVNWSNPGDIVYGTVLSGTQLDATFTWTVDTSTVTVAGVATYTPSAGTLLSAGSSQALAVNFAPADTTNYNAASATVHINVQKATPTVTWSNPADIAYGTPLSGTQLNAVFTWVVNGSTVNVPGTPAYTPAAGAVLNPGAGQVLTVNFTPSDTADYNNAGPKTVAINVGYGMCSASVGAGGVILPPINSDGTSVYNRKGGSTVPVKFRVCNASGASISNPALVFAGTGGTLTMLSAVRGTIDNINETTGTDIPDVAFRWDGQQWIFNMATNNLASGSTYAFRINLAYSPASITFVVGVK